MRARPMLKAAPEGRPPSLCLPKPPLISYEPGAGVSRRALSEVERRRARRRELELEWDAEWDREQRGESPKKC